MRTNCSTLKSAIRVIAAVTLLASMFALLQADEAAAYHARSHIQRSRQMERIRVSDCAFTNEGRQICGTFAASTIG